MALNELDSDLFQRVGIMAAFENWESAKKYLKNNRLFSIGFILQDDIELFYFQFVRRTSSAVLSDVIGSAAFEFRNTTFKK